MVTRNTDALYALYLIFRQINVACSAALFFQDKMNEKSYKMSSKLSDPVVHFRYFTTI